MTRQPTPEPSIQPTGYEVSLLPIDHPKRHHYTLYVEWRGQNLWAVTTGHRDALGTDGTFAIEPVTDKGHDAWIATHRYDHDTAIDLAKQHAPQLTHDGITALDTYRRGQ